jgi:hypothetical protein
MGTDTAGWQPVVSLPDKSAVATVLEVYETCVKVYSPAFIHGFMEKDGYYRCVVRPGEYSNFDFFEWLNSVYDAGVPINCANARLLFPASLSRGLYVVSDDIGSDTGNSDEDDNSDTGFWEDGEPDSKDRYVIHKSCNHRILISEGDGVIFGRSSSKCDYPIANDVVSRLHCRVYKSGGLYMVEDLGSKYGTFVNNLKVRPGNDVQISSGDSLRMANEEFYFE